MQFYFDLTVRKSVQETISSAKKLKLENPVKNDSDDDDVDDEAVIVKGKRKISQIIDSDSDSDYENDENESDNSRDGAKFSRKQSTGASAKKKINLEPSKKKSKTFEEKLKANNDESQSHMDIDENGTADIGDGLVVHKHQKIEFIKPEKIRDAQKRRPDDPKYDPTTLYIPDGFLDEQTPVNIVF